MFDGKLMVIADDMMTKEGDDRALLTLTDAKTDLRYNEKFVKSWTGKSYLHFVCLTNQQGAPQKLRSGERRWLVNESFHCQSRIEWLAARHGMNPTELFTALTEQLDPLIVAWHWATKDLSQFNFRKYPITEATAKSIEGSLRHFSAEKAFLNDWLNDRLHLIYQPQKDETLMSFWKFMVTESTLPTVLHILKTYVKRHIKEETGTDAELSAFVQTQLVPELSAIEKKYSKHNPILTSQRLYEVLQKIDPQRVDDFRYFSYPFSRESFYKDFFLRHLRESYNRPPTVPPQQFWSEFVHVLGLDAIEETFKKEEFANMFKLRFLSLGILRKRFNTTVY